MTTLDRRALKRILTAANDIRRKDGRVTEGTFSVYFVRAEKAGRTLTPQVAALHQLHQEAARAFGGRILKDAPSGLLAAFPQPDAAVQAAVHALHATDLVAETLQVAPCRIAIVHGAATIKDWPAIAASGPAVTRVAKVIARVPAGHAAVEQSVAASLRGWLEGHSDLEISLPKKERIPGLGAVTLVAVAPLRLKPEQERELQDVDAELRAARRPTKALRH